MKRALAWVSERREGFIVGGVAFALVTLGFVLGWWLTPAPEPRIVYQEKEKIVWQEKTETVAATTATAESKETVRVVTRWLRPDKTVAKEQVRESGTASSTTATSKVDSAVQRHSDSSRSSESRTAVDLRPRFHVQGLLGLDLGAGAARRWGASASVRIVGPIWVGAWALPGMKVGGASLGVTW